eukprot:3292640-Amphidinium_carterae.1
MREEVLKSLHLVIFGRKVLPTQSTVVWLYADQPSNTLDNPQSSKIPFGQCAGGNIAGNGN